VIPDNLKRDAYLSECSHRLNVNAQTLVTTVNTYIQRDKEEKQKERERGDGGTQQPERQEELIVPIGLHTAQKQTTEVERLLIQNIIRHGEEVIYKGVETEDGQIINLNVAQYIDYDLGADSLEFSNPLFNRILQEAVEHSAEPDFKADLYFMQHPDPEVSQLAANLGIDRHQLSRSFQVNSNSNLLRQRIEHLILDFRMDIVSQHLKELQRKMKEVGSDMAQVKELMEDYKQTQELRNALARQRGSDVIV
jgi:DNA primase